MTNPTNSDEHAYGIVDPRYGILATFAAAAWQSLAGNPLNAAAFAKAGTLLCMLMAWTPAIERLDDWSKDVQVEWEAWDKALIIWAVGTIAVVVVTVLVFLIWGVKLWSVVP